MFKAVGCNSLSLPLLYTPAPLITWHCGSTNLFELVPIVHLPGDHVTMSQVMPAHREEAPRRPCTTMFQVNLSQRHHSWVLLPYLSHKTGCVTEKVFDFVEGLSCFCFQVLWTRSKSILASMPQQKRVKIEMFKVMSQRPERSFSQFVPLLDRRSRSVVISLVTSPSQAGVVSNQNGKVGGVANLMGHVL